MTLDQLSGEIETQPGATNPFGNAILGTYEAPEDLRVLVARNANAAVLYAQAHGLVVLLGFGQDTNLASSRAVFDGVADEVGEHLFDPPGINTGNQPRRSCFKDKLVACCGVLERSDNALDERDEIGGNE